jgi:hypothetical protein
VIIQSSSRNTGSTHAEKKIKKKELKYHKYVHTTIIVLNNLQNHSSVFEKNDKVSLLNSEQFALVA